MTTTSQHPDRRRTLYRVGAGLTAAAALLVGVAAATADSGPSEPSGPKPSGIYAVSNQQWAYYAGIQAASGTPIDVPTSWTLSDMQVAQLSDPEPAE
jgi:hypothetical protein